MRSHEAGITSDTGDQDNSGVGFEVERMLPKADYKISGESIRQEHNRPVVALLKDGNKTFRVFDMREPNDDFNRANHQPKAFYGMDCSAETAFIILDENFELNTSDGPRGYKTIPYGQVVWIGKETESGSRFYKPQDSSSRFSLTYSEDDDSLVISLEYGEVGLRAAESPEVVKSTAYEAYLNKLSNELKLSLLNEWYHTFPAVDKDVASSIIDEIVNLDKSAKDVMRELAKQYHVDAHGEHAKEYQEINALVNVCLALRREFDKSI